MGKLINTAFIFGAGVIVGELDKTKVKEKIVNGVSRLLLGESAETYYGKRRVYRPYNWFTYRRRPYSYSGDLHKMNILNYTYESEDLANEVCYKMAEEIQEFSYASMLSLKRCIEEVTGDVITGYFTNNYGWNDISDVEVKPVVGGYKICWPEEKFIGDLDLEDDD